MNLGLWEDLVTACKKGAPPVHFEAFVEARAKKELHISSLRDIRFAIATGLAHSPVPCPFEPEYKLRPGVTIDGAFEFTYKDKKGYAAIIKLANGFLIKSFHASTRIVFTDEENRKRAEENLRKFGLGSWDK